MEGSLGPKRRTFGTWVLWDFGGMGWQRDRTRLKTLQLTSTRILWSLFSGTCSLFEGRGAASFAILEGCSEAYQGYSPHAQSWDCKRSLYSAAATFLNYGQSSEASEDLRPVASSSSSCDIS